MRVTLQFDTADIFCPDVLKAVDEYLRAEISAVQLCRRIGWTRQDFERHFGSIFAVARCGGPASLTASTNAEPSAADFLAGKGTLKTLGDFLGAGGTIEIHDTMKDTVLMQERT